MPSLTWNMRYLLRVLARRLVLALTALLLAVPIAALSLYRVVADGLRVGKRPARPGRGELSAIRPRAPAARHAPHRRTTPPASTSVRRVHVLDLPRPWPRWSSRLQRRVIETEGPGHRQLAQAVRDVTLAGLDEDEVRRHLEAMGAEWVFTRRRRRRPRSARAGAVAEIRSQTASRIMRMSYPKPTSFLHALALAPAIVTVFFDADGRAAGGSVRDASGR